MIALEIQAESFQLAEVFTISRGSRTQTDVITVRLRRSGHIGRGESLPYARYGESQESVTEQIEVIRPDLINDPDLVDLQSLLPAGAARNAVDCALWDLNAKEQGAAVWQLADLEVPRAVTTAYTLSLADPQIMQEKARLNAHRPLLKIKLGGENDLDRLRAVRRGAPVTDIIVDANEGWDIATYETLVPELKLLGVKMIEQPFPVASDAVLSTMQREIPVCADESCHDTASLTGLKGKYDVVNIKLDKTGGFSEALKLRSAAAAQGLNLMVGCMMSSSLAIAPAVLIAQGVETVDLDAPLLLAEDRDNALKFTGSNLEPPTSALWG